jgi:transcriptional regulator with XRE-family HTH domain
LPFCQARLAARKPAKSDYPKALHHLGDHLRRRRLELGLLQREVAKRLGASPASITSWELGHTAPALVWIPQVLLFLGYDPRSIPQAVGPRLRGYRQGRGISQEAMARHLGIDPGTLARWERGGREPQGKYLAMIQVVLGERRHVL